MALRRQLYSLQRHYSNCDEMRGKKYLAAYNSSGNTLVYIVDKAKFEMATAALPCTDTNPSLQQLLQLLSQRSCDNEVRARSEDLQMEGIRWSRGGSVELACIIVNLS